MALRIFGRCGTWDLASVRLSWHALLVTYFGIPFLELLKIKKKLDNLYYRQGSHPSLKFHDLESTNVFSFCKNVKSSYCKNHVHLAIISNALIFVST